MRARATLSPLTLIFAYKLIRARVEQVQHDYGYGVPGLPPRIPPYAVLHFEVELLSADASPPANADTEQLLELPDASAAANPDPGAEDGSGVRVVTVDGNPVKLDRLGPIVVNKDGSLSRITNWGACRTVVYPTHVFIQHLPVLVEQAR